MRTAFTMILIYAMTCAQAVAGTFTVALFDLSGSVLKDSTGQEGKDSPFSKNMAELKGQINKLGKGDTITVVGFGRKSDVTLLKATMPKQAGPMNRNLTATKEAAIRKLQENIKDKARSVDNSGTDVIGGIFRASRLFHETTNASKKQLIICSDLLDNENAGLSINRLKSQGSHREFLRRLEGRKIGYPDLREVEISLFSVFADIKNIGTVETEVAIKELKGFWGEYFRKSGGNVKSFRTSY